MPFFDDSHLEGDEITVGPPVSVLENIRRGYLQQYHVDSPYSLDFELQDAWQDSLNRYKEITGEEIALPSNIGSYGRYARMVQGLDQSATNTTLFGDMPENVRRDLEQFRRADQAIQSLNNPDVKSFGQVLEEVSKLQAEIEERTALGSETAGFTGDLAQLVGAIGGSFSVRDPVSLGTLGLGGFGRTVVQRIASEAGIAAALTGATDVAAVNPNRETAGLEQRDPLYDMLVAGLGAGILTGGAIAVGRGVSSLRARARTDVEFDFDDTQLRQMFEARPRSPDARAGLEILDAAEQVRRANPYGDTPAGTRRFVAELSEVQAVMNGAPSTAVARFLPEVSVEYSEQLANFELVKQEVPLVYGRMEEAQARVNEIDARVAELETGLEQVSIPQAVRLVDEQAGARLEELERIVNDATLPEPQRAAADIEAQSIIQRVGPDRVVKAVTESEIAPRKEVQRLRASRRAAVRKFREARRQVEVEVGKINRRKALIEGRQQTEALNVLARAAVDTPVYGTKLRYDYVEENAKTVQTLAESADDRAIALVQRSTEEVVVPEGMVRVYHSGEKGEGETGRWVSTNYQYASDYRADLPLFYMDIPKTDPRVTAEYPEQSVDRGFTFNFELTPEEAVRLQPMERRDLVDIGLEERVAGDFAFDETLEDGSVRKTTFRQALQDLDEDVKLEEAVRTCAT